MPLPRLIPCLDVAGGRVVKGIKFQGLRDVGDPVELGAAYSDAGADELVFLDISATVDAGFSAVDVAARVAEQVTIPFTFGGGIRTLDDATAVLEAGADKISVNSAALARPELIEELARVLGSQAVVVAIDTEDGRVRSHAATRDAARDTVEWARECEQRGAGELLVTSIDRDGTQNGYDLELLARAARRRVAAGDRIRRRGQRAAHRRRARGIAGRAARVDPARASGAPRHAARRAARPGGESP